MKIKTFSQKLRPSKLLLLRLLSVLAISALLLAGCSRDSSSGTPNRETAEDIREQIVTETGIDLVPLDFFDWDLTLSDLAGQVVVMHFWASWCVPCTEGFSAILDASNNLPVEDVRFISVNLDDYLDEESYISALDFLSFSNAQIENYQLQHDLLEIYSFFGLENIPTTIIYARSGSEQGRLGNEGDLFEPLLLQAINQALAVPLEE
ncbi:MAG: TlpA family protein disulfide reductase [Porticoccaceae bacterium]|jgi:thiol-disulfide isomerase/thioredoxin|nr:TlpA family protein disulfide reductase [Porticoccaceae bacterium]